MIKVKYCANRVVLTTDNDTARVQLSQIYTVALGDVYYDLHHGRLLASVRSWLFIEKNELLGFPLILNYPTQGTIQSCPTLGRAEKAFARSNILQEGLRYKQ